MSKACKHGHKDGRNKHGQCIGCVRAATRRWQAKNREYSRQKTKDWRENNPDKYEKMKEKQRHRQRSLSEEEREKVRQRNREWQKNNPDKIRQINRTRIAFKRNSMPKWADVECIKRIYAECPEGHHVDHIIPTKGRNVCGLHVETNLQYLPAKENMRKLNSFSEKELESGSPVMTAPG